MININLKNIKAVIFDMDGTMVDNADFHKIAWQKICLEHGIILTDLDYKQKISGFKNDQIFTNIFGKNLSKNKIIEYANKKENLYRKLYRPIIKEVLGLTNLILKIKKLNIKLAIATTATKQNRNFILRKLNLKNIFDVIVGEEGVKKGKPDPEIYLKTAKLLNINPKSCLVFEDTPAGVQSAKNTGMNVVGIMTSHSKEDLINADFIVKDFSELNIQYF